MKRQFEKVVITGGAGYVGSALVPNLLNLGHEVKVVDLFLYGDPFQGIKGNLIKVKGDIRDNKMIEREFSGYDAVIHLACISNDPSFELDPRLGKTINYDAFFNLLSSIRLNKIKRFIYASSSSVYGVRPEARVEETTECTPITDYGKYKLLCEQALLGANLPDCDCIIVRPGTICGYAFRLRLDLTVNLFTLHGLKNKKIRIFGGDQFRPNLNIKDMVGIYEKLLEAPSSQIAGQIFNTGCENLSVREIAERIQMRLKHFGVDVDLVTEDTFDHRSYRIYCGKLEKQLGYKTKHSIEDAVDTLFSAYRDKKIQDPLSNPIYSNIKTMQSIGLK